jgi:hypothetical protein
LREIAPLLLTWKWGFVVSGRWRDGRPQRKSVLCERIVDLLHDIFTRTPVLAALPLFDHIVHRTGDDVGLHKAIQRARKPLTAAQHAIKKRRGAADRQLYGVRGLLVVHRGERLHERREWTHCRSAEGSWTASSRDGR